MGHDKPPRNVAVAIIYDSQIARVLMVTSRKHPNLWICGVEKGETSGQAAVREAWEEAGSPRDIAAPTDDERLMMIAMEPGATKRPSVWHIHVIRTSEAAVARTADWPEQDERQRSWFSLTDALGKISQWGSDLQAGDSASDEGKVAKGPAKKALKGGAMETAFRAFMESEGISPVEQP